MNPWLMLLSQAAPYLVQGGLGALGVLTGKDEWTDLRRGRNDDWYTALQGQLGTENQGIQGLLDAISTNTAGYSGEMNRLRGRLEPFTDLLSGLGNRMAGYTGQFENLQNQLARQGAGQMDIIRQMNDPNSYLRYMTNLGQQSTNQANQAYQNMFGNAETDAARYAGEAARAARQEAASQMANAGLLNTGAALDTITGAGLQQQLQAASELAAMRGQMTGQTFNNLMGAGSQAYQNFAGNAIGGMNALNQLFGTRGSMLEGALGALGQAGNQYGNAANTLVSLMNARNAQAGTELGALGAQLQSRQNTWGSLLNALQQDQQYEYNYTQAPTWSDFFMGLAGGSGQGLGMNTGNIANALQSLFGGSNPAVTGNVGRDLNLNPNRA